MVCETKILCEAVHPGTNVRTGRVEEDGAESV